MPALTISYGAVRTRENQDGSEKLMIPSGPELPLGIEDEVYSPARDRLRYIRAGAAIMIAAIASPANKESASINMILIPPFCFSDREHSMRNPPLFLRAR
jgi:hypothetical protein